MSKTTLDNINNEKIWNLDLEEVGYVMVKNKNYILASTNPIKLKIKSIVPAQLDWDPGYTPKERKQPLSDSIYCNDKDCRPTVAKVIEERNYIEVPRYANSQYRHRRLAKGAMLKLDIRNGDIDDIYITGKYDPSYCETCEGEHPTCEEKYPDYDPRTY